MHNLRWRADLRPCCHPRPHTLRGCAWSRRTTAKVCACLVFAAATACSWPPGWSVAVADVSSATATRQLRFQLAGRICAGQESKIDCVSRPTMAVDAIADQLQCANRRRDVCRVSSDRCKTERCGGEERSRGRVGKRPRLVSVVQQRAMHLLKRVFRRIKRQR